MRRGEFGRELTWANLVATGHPATSATGPRVKPHSRRVIIMTALQWRQRLPRLALALVSAVAPMAVASPAAAGTCDFNNARAGDFATGTPSDVNGVTGQIFVPSIPAPSPSQGPSAADIYIINGGDFVQLGWYVGSTSTGLPFVTVPHAFWGEYVAGAVGNEYTHDLGAISQGFYQFLVKRDESTKNSAGNGRYVFSIDGAQRAQTVALHPTGSPAFDGETNYACVTMDGASERNPHPPYGTLYYYSVSTGAHFWPGDSLFHSAGYYSELFSNSAGSDFAPN